jgi:type III secretion protein N (ATPase)
VRASAKFRAMMAKLKDIELLVQLGEYQQGQDSLADYALENRDAINHYLRQGQNEPSALSNTTAVLRSIGGEYGD